MNTIAATRTAVRSGQAGAAGVLENLPGHCANLLTFVASGSRGWCIAMIALLAVFCSPSAPTQEAPAREDAWGGIRLFAADLSAANQPTVTVSEGKGVATIKFDIPTMTISWNIEYDGLTSPPTGIQLHGPAQPGTNAVAIVDLGSNGLKSPIVGSIKVTDAHAQYMLLGWTYVLLKTRKYPDGELRGKLDTVPPPGFKRTAGR
jgi:hypothetical protein